MTGMILNKTVDEETIMRHQAVWVALVEQKIIGLRSCLKMLMDGFSVEDIWNADDALLKQYIRQADRRKRFLSIAAQTHLLIKAYDFVAGCLEKGIHIVPFDSDYYPPLLREIYDPPLLLYVRGNVASLDGGETQKTLAVVGTRRMSEYGKQVTEKLVAECAPYGASIISGLAEGVDAEAHRTAIRCHLPTVAVFGCGIDRIFPSFHQQLAAQIIEHNGALISEWPPGYPGDKYTFPKRNRIIAGMSEGTLVVEGAIKSGALITAKTAFEEGRQVFTVPGNIFNPVSQGPIYLIKNGVSPVTSASEIAEELRWESWQTSTSQHLFKKDDFKEEQSTTQPLEVELSLPEVEQNQTPQTEAETKAEIKKSVQTDAQINNKYADLLAFIPHDPISIERLQEKSGLTLPQVTEQLTMLELEGMIKCLPGQHVSRFQ